MMANSESADSKVKSDNETNTDKEEPIMEKIDPSKVDRSMLIACFRQNDFAKAEVLARILLDRTKETFGAESAETWGASMEYIEVQKRLKNDEIALDLYLQLEPLTTTLFGEEHENAASLFNNIAMLYYHTFQHTKTVPYFKKTLAIWEKKYPADDQRVVTTRNNIFVNQQMSFFDTESNKNGIKIMKMDFTRDLHGRKPQNPNDNDDDDDAKTENDPKKMAAFQEAIDQRFKPYKDQSNNNSENSTQQNKINVTVVTPSAQSKADVLQNK
eukprot:29850_1